MKVKCVLTQDNKPIRKHIEEAGHLHQCQRFIYVYVNDLSDEYKDRINTPFKILSFDDRKFVFHTFDKDGAELTLTETIED